MKDDQIIYEKYLQENIKKAALSVLCALGIGCGTIDKGIDKLNNMLSPDYDAPLPHNYDAPTLQYLYNMLSDNDQKQLQLDIQQVLLTTGTPDEGWEVWINNWMKQKA